MVQHDCVFTPLLRKHFFASIEPHTYYITVFGHLTRFFSSTLIECPVYRIRRYNQVLMRKEADHSEIFGEKQVSDIIQRAAELQSETADSGLMGLASKQGLNAPEIERVAAEFGIRAEYVQAAIREFLQERDKEKVPVLSGANNSIEGERILPGEMTQQEWESLVAEIQMLYHVQGEWEQLENRQEWVWRAKDKAIMLRAKVSQGTTRIQASAHHGNVVETSWIVAGIIGLIAWLLVALPIAEAFPQWVSAVLASLLVLGGFVVTRASLTTWYKQEQRKMNKLFHQVEAVATARELSLEARIAQKPNSGVTEESDSQSATTEGI